MLLVNVNREFTAPALKRRAAHLGTRIACNYRSRGTMIGLIRMPRVFKNLLICQNIQLVVEKLKDGLLLH
jgi:hypothetical protein